MNESIRLDETKQLQLILSKLYTLSFSLNTKQVMQQESGVRREHSAMNYYPDAAVCSLRIHKILIFSGNMWSLIFIILVIYDLHRTLVFRHIIFQKIIFCFSENTRGASQYLSFSKLGLQFRRKKYFFLWKYVEPLNIYL